jgi:hypothetical protein
MWHKKDGDGANQIEVGTMTNNQRLIAELTRCVEKMETRLMDLCDESDLSAIDDAHEFLADLHAAMA